jgi:DNA polymerase-4
MLQLPLGKLWGAGEKTQERFRELGIVSVAQLANIGRESMRSLFGKAGGDFLYDAARGRDPGMFSGEAGSRSMSSETTFERDVSDRETLEAVLLGLADGLTYRLWDEGLRSRGIALKLRYQDFTTLTRRSKRSSLYRTAEDAFEDALALLDKTWDGRGAIRLIGIGFIDLESWEGGEQGELFDDFSDKRRRAQEAIFEIERRGLGQVRRARLLDKENDVREEQGKRGTKSN